MARSLTIKWTCQKCGRHLAEITTENPDLKVSIICKKCKEVNVFSGSASSWVKKVI